MVDSGYSCVNGLCLCFFRINIHASAYYRSCADEFNQSAYSVCSRFAEVRIDTFFISSGSLCSERQSLGCRSYAVCIEVCRFNYDCLRICGNFGIQSPHHACNRYRLLRIVNHQHSVVKRSFVSVQRNELFAFGCRINNNLVAFKTFDVKGVHRLTVFEHYKVRNINDVVNRSHSCMNQSSLQPPRRILYLDILYDSGNVSFAKR